MPEAPVVEQLSGTSTVRHPAHHPHDVITLVGIKSFPHGTNIIIEN